MTGFTSTSVSAEAGIGKIKNTKNTTRRNKIGENLDSLASEIIVNYFTLTYKEFIFRG
ncbi:MAG: hypothetical protein PHH67_06025 [Methanosarcina sp.]|nr:hypothetical protein [Methanosarcina sp.]MDD4306055.1 hypothetical protein [Methanosarcina sp.]MDD4619562.1 hypothetical protein [Methanosarcina sp.]